MSKESEIVESSEIVKGENTLGSADADGTQYVPVVDDNDNHRPTTNYQCVCAAPENPIAIKAYKALVSKLADILNHE